MGPDLSKIRHFGRILKFIWQLLKAFLVFGKKFERTVSKLLCYWKTFHCFKMTNRY